MNDSADIRWKQRFQNFSRAFNLLRDSLDDHSVDDYNQLEQEGIIQRFEYTFELAWKTLKDYLEFNGVDFEAATPRQVIKEAVTNGLFGTMDISGEVYLDMMLARNLLSHTYDFEKFQEIITKIQSEFLPELEKQYDYLLIKLVADLA